MTDSNSGFNLYPYISFGAKFFGGLFVVGLIVLYNQQNNILYIPNPPGIPKTINENPPYARSPAEWTISGKPKRSSNAEASIPYDEIFLDTVDGKKIHCWLLQQHQNNPNVPTLIYFHGNAGNMGFRLQNAAEMYGRLGINVVMMDYRGYGSSSGEPTEVGLNIDGETVLKYVQKLKRGPIVLFGRSLGGAVAISLAHKFPNLVQGVIVENTFLSIGAMVDRLFGYFSFLKYILLTIKWDNDVNISKLSQPIMFISGDSDELVPPFHMKKLYDLAVSSKYKDFYSVFGGTHNDTWVKAGKKYYERMRDFFDHVSAAEQGNSSQCNANLHEGDNDIEDEVKLTNSIPTMTESFGVK